MNSKTLKVLRTLRGLTQKQMAENLRLSQQAYSKMENGTWISSSKAKEIIAILECSETELEGLKKLINQH